MRLIRELSFALAVIGAAWMTWLIVVGGFELRIFGQTITSNEPVRPFLLASVALAVFIWSGPGADRAWQWVRDACAGADDRVVATLLAGGVAAAGIAYGSAVAAGSDAYGYVSQADLWLGGRLAIEQPWVAELPWPNAEWTAAPLGYRPIEPGPSTAIVPTYSPGLPLLMAAAKGVFGHAALFWVVPLSGAVLVLATYGIGRRLGSALAGVAAAWFVATSPIVLFMLMPAMSDVATAAAWTAAFFFAAKPGRSQAAASGVVSAIAILIRPNLAPIAVVLAIWQLLRARRDAVAFAIGVLPGVAALMWIYARLYGSPFTSGYGGLGDAFSWAHILPNLQRYAGWFVQSQTLLGVAGLAAVIVPARRLWPWVVEPRAVLAMTAIVMFVVAQYLAYLVFDDWWFLRFMLPCWPFAALGLAGLLFAAPARRSALHLAAAWLTVALGLYNLRAATKLPTFELWQTERAVVDVAHAVRDATHERSLVLALTHSGTLRYYGGRVTLRYDSLPADWLDRAAEWLQARGIGAYALLEPDEVPAFKQRFAGARAVADLDESDVMIYGGARTAVLYDLTRTHPGKARVAPLHDLRRFRAEPPVPLPALSVK